MASSDMTQTNITTNQLALLALKSQIISDPSNFLDESWSPATSVCYWVGVTSGSGHQRLKSLNLSNMALTGRIPREFGNLTFLVSIDLESNNFEGNLPQEMALLCRLKLLRLSFNSFSGEVPSWFGFLHQLQVLNLRINSFIGSIPSSFSNISTLETLNLKFNSIEGHIPVSLSNASRLEKLELSYHSVQGDIPEGIGNLHSMKWLAIQYNKLMGSIPFTIFNISRIEFIAFTGNSLSGSLPNGLCNGLPVLKGLYLSYNKLHHHMPTSLSNCSQLQILSLLENEFDGPIYSEIGRLSNLQLLYLGYNHFTGIIPQEIGDLVNLTELWMEKNQITGTVPISILNISSLQILSLWKNNLSGSLPEAIGNLTKMQFSYLHQNRFTGEIPKEISNLIELEELDLSTNSFSGSLDMEIFNISGLRTTSLTDNNNLSGIFPPNIGSILPNIEELYLSGLTNLVGTIPHSISNCSKLTILELANNKLTGLIPNSLGYFTQLQLSSNMPPSLGNLHDLVVLDLSSNNMGPFKNLSSQVFIHNEALHGSSRFSVPPCPTSSKHRSNRKILLVLFLLLAIAVIFVPTTFVLLWIRHRTGKRAPAQAESLSTIRTERISYNELLQATDGLSKSNLIGFGSFGSVYKGILSNGTAIAVKVFNLQVDVAFKSIDTECEVFRSLLHRNLVEVITSCSNLDFKALVLEYMPNGSLKKYLYSHNYFLDIRQSLSIMLDVACVFEYLHHGCTSPVIHCYLKLSNILLAEDMVAHLSDFGFSKLLGEDESDLYTKTLATFGYIALGTCHEPNRGPGRDEHLEL
ncbi:putative LRR receptor-like serine/threonine-protein kinase-like [Capsicum annuum]|nr:putative LRR receptor-like serine/threonine-protein kinase-like [Capsicum annuum]